ncbi:SDR family NAD(P)-dependent oxidoreductase [Hyphococcus sp.]|uniref:SDR family NAD(P)-dependent oxidoreductase n=1 Tax=Hyphococcus sp. TaxID=2038636 RepID=UPI003CCB76AD
MSSFIEKTGRAAIVTGSSRGIGNAIASQLATAGYNVMISSRRAEACTVAANRINETEGRAVAVPFAVDIADKQALEEVVNTAAESFGRIDSVVCNAASSPYFGSLRDAPDSDFETMLNNNILSAHWLTRFSTPHMKNIGGGSIIYIASIGGLRAYDNIGAYSVSKAAMLQLARNYARELGPSNIRVNAISPGVIETDFSKSTIANPKLKAAFESETFVGRLGLPEDIAPMVVFLAGPNSSFLTGQNIIIDGGASV